MKRTLYPALALALTAFGMRALNGSGYAHEPAKDDLRYEVTASLGKFVDAANQADTTTLMAMISPKPEVSVVADGEVYRGTADVQAHIERLLGQRGRYVCQLGPLAIADVHGLALATGPYTLRTPDGEHALAAHGVVTFLMERTGRRKWLIVHMHRSMTAVRPPLD